MSLVGKIQNLCEDKGTTLIGLERKVGLGRGTIRNWDKNSPSIDKIKKVADYFNVSTDWLLGRVEEKRHAVIENEDIPQELRELGVSWLKVTKEFKERGFTPEEIKKVIDAVTGLNKK